MKSKVAITMAFTIASAIVTLSVFPLPAGAANAAADSSGQSKEFRTLYGGYR